MVSTYTTNINLEEPARGDQVGTWDTPVNANMTLLDLVLGGTTSIPLAGAPVVLNAAQFGAKTIVFSSTLTASVTITFPTSFCKSYEILSQCTGSSAFTITLQSTSGGQAVCVPPNEFCEVVNIAGQFFFKNLGRVGTYWDYAGSSVPNWVSGCSVPPYLNCDGTAFSSATYPHLRNILGSATLPDARGRFRATLNQTTNRITAAGSNLNGDTFAAGGGDQNLHQHSHANSLTDPGHTHTSDGVQNLNNTTRNAGVTPTLSQGTGETINAAFTGITITNANSGTGASGNIPPAYIGGLTLVRAG